MARHLHEQSGGDPSAQGPVSDLANEPAARVASSDFPDTPPGNRPRQGDSDLTDEQLADFAGRLGLVDDPASVDDPGPHDTARRPGDATSDRRGVRGRFARARRSVRRPAARVLVVAGGAVATAGTTAGAWMRAAGERLEPR
jgi:hypothetical protein